MESSTDTQRSTSEVAPPETSCGICGKAILPIYLHGVERLGIQPRWLSGSIICGQCAVEKKEAEANAKKLSDEQSRLNKAFKASRITPRFRERTFANYNPSQTNEAALRAAIGYNPIQSDGLMLLGPPGTGKTHLAASIANKYLSKIPVLFVSCPELLIEIRESYKINTKINSLDAAKEVRLLIIDDIGAEKASDWVRETLFVLINHRYEHKLPTILTTNCNLEQLAEKLGARIASRLVEMCRMIRVDGPDHRMKIRKELNG